MTDLEKAKAIVDQGYCWVDGIKEDVNRFTYGKSIVIVWGCGETADIKDCSLIPHIPKEPKQVVGQLCWSISEGVGLMKCSRNHMKLYYKSTGKPALRDDLCTWDELDHGGLG